MSVPVLQVFSLGLFFTILPGLVITLLSQDWAGGKRAQGLTAQYAEFHYIPLFSLSISPLSSFLPGISKSKTANLLQLLQRQMSSVQQGFHLTAQDGESHLWLWFLSQACNHSLISSPVPEPLIPEAFWDSGRLTGCFSPGSTPKFLSGHLSTNFLHCTKSIATGLFAFHPPKTCWCCPSAVASCVHHHYSGVLAGLTLNTCSGHQILTRSCHIQILQPQRLPQKMSLFFFFLPIFKHPQLLFLYIHQIS